MNKFFGKFAKEKKPKKQENVTVIEVQTGAKISYAGYKAGDTVTQEYQASALLTELRSKSNVGEQI